MSNLALRTIIRGFQGNCPGQGYAERVNPGIGNARAGEAFVVGGTEASGTWNAPIGR